MLHLDLTYTSAHTYTLIHSFTFAYFRLHCQSFIDMPQCIRPIYTYISMCLSAWMSEWVSKCVFLYVPLFSTIREQTLKSVLHLAVITTNNSSRTYVDFYATLMLSCSHALMLLCTGSVFVILAYLDKSW